MDAVVSNQGRARSDDVTAAGMGRADHVLRGARELAVVLQRGSGEQREQVRRIRWRGRTTRTCSGGAHLLYSCRLNGQVHL